MPVRARGLGALRSETSRPSIKIGEMSEWFKEHAWKACVS